MSKPERLDAIGAVAIIGLAGRFPGARDVGVFWENLRAGVESISHFSDAELAAWGIDVAACRRDGAFVPARGILQDLKMFDARFFGIHRVEAEVMDPQHRLFLESAWEALEDAGYDPETYRGSIGVYGGASRNAYFAHNLLGRADVLARAGMTRVVIGNEKDYLTTRVSYKLNLRGPSINVARRVLDFAGRGVPRLPGARSTSNATWPWPAACLWVSRSSAGIGGRTAGSRLPTATAEPSTRAVRARSSATALGSSCSSGSPMRSPTATRFAPSSSEQRSTTMARPRSVSALRASTARRRSSPWPRLRPGSSPTP